MKLEDMQGIIKLNMKLKDMQAIKKLKDMQGS